MEKLYNPISGRWVSSTGKIGKIINKQYGDLSSKAMSEVHQFYVNIDQRMHKTKELIDLLDELEFNKVLIFTKPEHSAELTQFLQEVHFPAVEFKPSKKLNTRIIVASETDSAKINYNGIDLVINFDMSPAIKTYLHCVVRVNGHEGHRRAISIIASPADRKVLENVQKTFKITIAPLSEPSPDEEPSDY